MPYIKDLKDGPQLWQPLLLVALTVQGRNEPLLLSTHPLDGVSGPTFPGVGTMPAGIYQGRIAEQDIEALQHRSQLGIDRVSKFTVHIYDADHNIYNDWCALYGFRGATMQVCLTMWQAGTANFTTDAPIQFFGTCDMEVPTQGGDVIAVTANTGHNTATVKLPLFPIQNRCPLHFPTTQAERKLAAQPGSTFCPYCPDQFEGIGPLGNTAAPDLKDAYGNIVTDGSGNFVMCDFIRSNPKDPASGCMPRMGNPATTSVAPDGDLWHDKSGRPTGVFAGIEWSPGTLYQWVKNYTSNTTGAAFSFLNKQVLGQYQNLLYGTQWVNAKIANVVESGNDTKCEAMVCTGDVGPGGVQHVVVNEVELTRAGSRNLDGSLTDSNLWWDFNNTGNRLATSRNTDTGYSDGTHSSLSDPYGSICCIRTAFYKEIFSGFGVPTIRVFATGPQLMFWAPIDHIEADGTNLVITWPAGFTNLHISGPATIIQNSNPDLNVSVPVYTAFTSTTITFPSSATGSGTGGYIGMPVGPTSTNPAWVLLDVLTRSNWGVNEIDLGTFYNASVYCDGNVNYINQLGQPANHARFKCQFVLEQRKTAAEVIAGILRCCNGYLAWTNGKLQLYINQTLGESQPNPVDGSNYNTAVLSFTSDFKGDWSASAVYQTGDVVTYSGGTYQSNIADNFNITPGTTGDWNLIFPTVGYLAYLFDETNIARASNGSMDLNFEQNATILTPNQIIINFQDEDNQWQEDSLADVDAHAVTRAGNTLQPGGSLIPETLNVIGISNFDQATRISNTYLAERQYGNELGLPIGTRVITFKTTVSCEHLRVGHIVGLTLQIFGYNVQTFRVIKIAPKTDYELCTITVQWHDDIWYTDIYGQQPQAFYGDTMLERPLRAPNPWQPYDQEPDSPSSGPWPLTEWTFKLAEMDSLTANGTPMIILEVRGDPPVNQITATCQPPLMPTQAATSVSSGSVPQGNYFVQIAAKDSDGNYTVAAPRNPTLAILTGTGHFTINNIGWDLGTAGYDVFVGTDAYNLTFQQTGSVTWSGGVPSPISITVSSLPNVIAYAPPDLAAGFIQSQAKEIFHAGIIGERIVSVSGSSVVIGAPPSGTLGDVSGRYLMLLGRPNLNDNLPLRTYHIVSNSGSTLTLDRSASGLQKDDVVVVTTKVDTFGNNVIGDSGFASAYGPTGVNAFESGFVVRIIWGKGRGQYRTITGVGPYTTAHLTANINASVTSIPVSDTTVLNNTYITFGTETMFVTAGGGTTTLTVTRGQLGTTAASHTSGTAISGPLTTYTVTPAWNDVPDATSIFIVEEQNWRFLTANTPDAASTYSEQLVNRIDVSNYADTAILVQPVVLDATQSKKSTTQRNPVRMIFLTGLQGTRIVVQNAVELPSDGLVNFDTSGVVGGTPTTLSADIADTDDQITVAGTQVVNGTYIEIDSEIIYVLSGGGHWTWVSGVITYVPGSTTLQVMRGQLNTTPAAHTSGTTVTVPGAMTFQLLPVDQQPNQIVTLHKTSTDLNYVLIMPDPTIPDVLPDGDVSYVLADTSSNRGTYTIKATGTSTST